ncbi:MAG TPA: hypothetical protein VFF69_00505 [Phycisphaerales bacterium]|nr:hypothetical protein [Phycisphaerales bacterium]
MIWLLATISLLVGLALLGVGLRGRNIGDAPHCRRCGFDLTGIETDADAEQSDGPPRCPECGRDLGARRAVRIGVKQRRHVVASLGVAGVLLACGALALALVASNARLNGAKPTWLLLAEASMLRGGVSQAAAAELLDRHNTAPLAPGSLARIVPGALRAQADPNVDWPNSPWWPLLEGAFVADEVSGENLARYVRAALSDPSVGLPNNAVASEPWPARLYPLDLRFPSLRERAVPAGAVGYIATLESATLDGAPLPLEPAGPQRSDGQWDSRLGIITVLPGGAFGFRSFSGMELVPTPFPPHRPASWSLPPGEHELVLVYTVRGYAGDSLTLVQTGERAEPTTQFTHRVSHRLTVHASPASFVRMVGPDEAAGFDPSCSAPMQGGIQVRKWPDTPSPCLALTMSLHRDDAREGTPWIIGRVVLRSGDRSWPLARSFRQGVASGPAYIALAPAGEAGPQGVGTQFFARDLPRLESVDVVIVPDLAEAGRVGLAERVWAEEIVIPGVPLDWTDAPGAVPGVEPGG